MKKIIFVLSSFFVMGMAFAQDPHLSQFYQSPLYMNPAFTGVTPQQRAAFNYRIQWPSLPQAFSTYVASYDIWVNELRSGFGVLATTDKMGTANWRTTTVGLSYSYKIKISDKIVISPGVYFGYGLNGLDRSKLTLGDALEYDGVTLDPQLQSVGQRQYFDFSSGLLMYSKKIWFGTSVSHINTPNISILNITSRLPLKINIHGGMRLPLSGKRQFTRKPSYLTPSFVFQIQGPVSQLNLGINYHFDPVSAGIWYRGKPFELSKSGIPNQDALIFQLGGHFSNFDIGYSYDFSISPLGTTAGGAHEVSIVYQFVLGSLLKRDNPQNKLIPCPSLGSRPDDWK